MDTKKQNIHYCTILSAGQWDFLLDGKAAIDRQKCLHRLMTAAVRTKAVLHIKGVEIALEVGQAAASDVELAEYMGCNRKTIGKLIDSFNRLGMLTTRTNNRTSVHTLHFLTGWYVDGVLLTNPHYVKPAAVSKGQTDGVRTPYSNDTPSENILVFGPQLLIGVAAVGFVPKKAIGAADGIKGTFAYLIGDSFAKLGLGMIADGTPIFGLTGWAGTFAALDAAAIGCICLMAIVAVFEERKIRRQKKTQTLQTA